MGRAATATLRRTVIWAAVGIGLGALAGTSLLSDLHLSLKAGLIAWFIDGIFVLVAVWRPSTGRMGVLAAGLFLAVPCHVKALPVIRCLLMCGMASALVPVVASLSAPPTAGFRERLAYLFTWLGTRELKQRPRSFDARSLLHFFLATAVLTAAIAIVRAVPASGLARWARWLAGGTILLAFAEMVTAGHDFLTALLGLQAPALMRSPHKSGSLAEFWTERWNPAASALLFRRLLFIPLARRGPGLAFLAAFLGSAVAHIALFYMATGRWRAALVWGAFFVVQPLLIAAERRMKVRRWGPTARCVWTGVALAVTSPLFVEPFLQLMEPTWDLGNHVLAAPAQVLAVVIFLDGVVALGSRLSLRGASPSDKNIGVNPCQSRQQTAPSPGFEEASRPNGHDLRDQSRS